MEQGLIQERDKTVDTNLIHAVAHSFVEALNQDTSEQHEYGGDASSNAGSPKGAPAIRQRNCNGRS